ncbi:sigma-70 family RNA polymerase sigma factor [Streptomyces sp. NPDC048550]|uniref:RNA polymerase sigma factor n=1 Tax=unclassified Streptomyces TaxID=2593676 RepID=UPI003438B285
MSSTEQESVPAGIGPPDLSTPEGFGAFYQQHIDAVLGFVTRRVADPHLAADLTADIFLAALKAAPGYRPDRGVPVAWLYGIARHVLAGHARGRARERGALERLSGRRLLDDEDVAALEERIDAQRAFRVLAERHAALSEPLRAVLDLIVVDGLSPAEAAQALGVTQATVRVRLHRARRILRTASAPSEHPVPAHQLEAAR